MARPYWGKETGRGRGGVEYELAVGRVAQHHVQLSGELATSEQFWESCPAGESLSFAHPLRGWRKGSQAQGPSASARDDNKLKDKLRRLNPEFASGSSLVFASTCGLANAVNCLESPQALS